MRLFLAWAFALGCTPPGLAGEQTEEPVSTACPFGREAVARGLRPGEAPAPATLRLLDGAVLLAHWPAGSPADGFRGDTAQVLDGGVWVDSPLRAIDPCGAGAHVPLVTGQPEAPRPAVTARGRVLTLACGERVDEVTTEIDLDPSADPAAAIIDLPCTGDRWLWLWNARSCADILARFPNAPTGRYTIDPDGPAGDPPGEAFCDQVSLGGGWTRVLGVRHGPSGEAPEITRPTTLREGLAVASAEKGYVTASSLGALPPREGWLSFRFYCHRHNSPRLHLMTAQPHLDRFLTGEVFEPPQAQVTRVLQSDLVDTGLFGSSFGDDSTLGRKPQFWGQDPTFFNGWASGRWGDLSLSLDLEDRVADHPMYMPRDDENDLPRGFRATQEFLECDGGAAVAPDAEAGVWMVFAR